MDPRRRDPEGDAAAPADGGEQQSGGIHEARVAALIDCWLDGTITPAEIGEMEGALLESAAARREFWRRAGFHGLLHEAARIRFAGMPDAGGRREPSISAKGGRGKVDVPGLGQRGTPTVRRWLRVAMTAAACLLLLGAGWAAAVLSSSSRAFAGRFVPDVADPFVALAEGFEAPPYPLADYLPTTTDCWSGDETRVVGREAMTTHGILPHSGDHVLQFVSGHPRGESYPGSASEVWRFIDLDQLRALVGSSELRVELSAWYNAAAVAEDRRPLCGLKAIATSAEPGRVDSTAWLTKPAALSDLDARILGSRPVASGETCNRLDGDPASWQRVVAVVVIPIHARYLLLHCFMRDECDVPFDAGGGASMYYVDDITVTVEPIAVPRSVGLRTLPAAPGGPP